MTWKPGQPVVSDDDRIAWEGWRRDRKRQQQRERRARNPRIDYYPDAHALATINQLRRPWTGGDLSSVISKIINEWAAWHRNK